MSVKPIYQPLVVALFHSQPDVQKLFDWARMQEVEISGPIKSIIDAIVSGNFTLDHIVEFAGRVCYRSWNAGRSHEEYVRHILEERHGNVLEHAWINFSISGVSRSLSHELVRHHTGFSVSQESQRFVDMKNAEFVVPPAIADCGIIQLEGADVDVIRSFLADCEHDLARYLWWQRVLQAAEVKGKKNVNQAARFKLPNATATRMFGSFNLRELRNVLEQRGGSGADPEIRRLAGAILAAARPLAPNSLFDFEETDEFGTLYPVITSRHQKV